MTEKHTTLTERIEKVARSVADKTSHAIDDHVQAQTDRLSTHVENAQSRFGTLPGAKNEDRPAE